MTDSIIVVFLIALPIVIVATAFPAFVILNSFGESGKEEN